MRNRVYRFLIALIGIFILGCANTEYMKDRAADKAREYIFEQVPNMSPENRTFIKYTYPIILTSQIMSASAQKDNSTGYTNGTALNFQQVGFAWDLPSPKVRIIVVGSSNINYFDWEPLRLIINPADDKLNTWFEKLYVEDSPRK